MIVHKHKMSGSRCCLCGDRSPKASLICEPCWCDLISDRLTCDRCGRGVARAGVCSQCLAGSAYIDKTLALMSYEFPAVQLLLSLKYKQQLSLAREFGQRLAEKILAQGPCLPDLIVPVPLHPARLIRRGYNQALEIARVVSKHLGVPMDYRGARRIRNTSPQFSLSPPERERNIRGAFTISNPVLSGTVAIVDDIVTTGHTANELAKQLKAAGATAVCLWACALAEPGDPVPGSGIQIFNR